MILNIATRMMIVSAGLKRCKSRRQPTGSEELLALPGSGAGNCLFVAVAQGLKAFKREPS